jgi:hypothetical protein
MNKQLLTLLAFFILAGVSFAQTIANKPPDMLQCDSDIFNLNSQTPKILGDQNPSLFTVKYYDSGDYVVTDYMPLTNIEAYKSKAEYIFARVTNIATGKYAITNFKVAHVPAVLQENDVTVCGSYNVGAPFLGNYFTGPGGTGTIIPNFSIIKQDATIYSYVKTNNCSAQSSFKITVKPLIELTGVSDVYSCTNYTLPALARGNYYTGSGGSGTLIPAGTVIASSRYIYAYYLNENGCASEKQFYVSIGNNVPSLSSIFVCESYVLPPLAKGLAYYNGPRGAGTVIEPETVLTTTQTVYIYSTSATCTGQNSFTVTIVPIPAINTPADVITCESYTLPPLANGNYYTKQGGPNGGGVLLTAGTSITTTQTLYVYASEGDRVNCFVEGKFKITIPKFNTPDVYTLTACNDDGVADFDLTTVSNSITETNQEVEIAFYNDEFVTQNIPQPQSYISSQGLVYLKLTSHGCSKIVPLELSVVPCTDNLISGNFKYDYNGNGCDAADVNPANIMISCTTGESVQYTFTNTHGFYKFSNVPNGLSTVATHAINNQQYAVSPNDHSVSLPGDGTGNNFCLSVPNPVNDVAVYFTNALAARPGFVAYYNVTITNKGSFKTNGTITIQFDATKLTYIPSVDGAVVNGYTITLNYSDLWPFSSQRYSLMFKVAEPPVANSGDIITFTANAISLMGDDTLHDNVFTFNQMVVNSYDPNDIMVKEGKFITLAEADDYLHYTIRFQNEGTANAEIVRVATTLNDKLDWDTFEPVSASHTFQANRTQDATEFVFNNIQLPFKSVNEPGSHGFISYRIKPKAGVKIGDVLSAAARIYFDFNEAIVTNTVTTTIQQTASSESFKANDFILYPNPASGIVIVKIKNGLTGDVAITINDVLGKVISRTNISGTQPTINIAGLEAGIYFVAIRSGNGQVTKKLIVK